MTDYIEEWGPWIEHDGKGCPCVGFYIQATSEWKEHLFGTEGLVRFEGAEWDWSNFPMARKLIRYRIRKPRALRDLITLVETLPAPQRHTQEAFDV